MQKLYCYVDESGQDTKGELFLVAIVISDKRQLDSLEQRLLELEKETGKRTRKWGWLNVEEKAQYLQSILGIKELHHSIFYSVCKNSKEYTRLTASSIARAILARINGSGDYKASIFIDGLKGRENEVVRREIKKFRVNYAKIRGLDHRKSALIRLADAMAGFLRDCCEGKEYSKRLFSKFRKSGMARQI